jgi:hypothetical protein
MRRQQRRPPPQRIGPRPRNRRNRDDAKGSRVIRNATLLTKKVKKRAKKKLKGAKRVLCSLYNAARWELRTGSESVLHLCDRIARSIEPQLITIVERMTRTSGIALQTLSDFLAPVVQVGVQRDPLVVKELTGADEGQPETFGPSGRLEPSDAGHSIFALLSLKSWKWDEAPTRRNEDFSGSLWPPTWFGVREEEQAFT